jgi:hypothetical protein
MADARDGDAEVLALADAVLLASDRSRATWECGAGRARLPRAAALALGFCLCLPQPSCMWP